jgi:hypothetical protein
LAHFKFKGHLYVKNETFSAVVKNEQRYSLLMQAAVGKLNLQKGALFLLVKISNTPMSMSFSELRKIVA